MSYRFLSKITLIFFISSFVLLKGSYAQTAKEFFDQGDQYSKQEKYDEAIQAYTKAIELNPKYPEAYFKRAINFGLKHNYELTISDYSKAIELNPNYAKAYYFRGIANYNKAYYDKAQIDIKKAQDLGEQVNPDFIKDLNNQLNGVFSNHYFNKCKDEDFLKITKGMLRDEVRNIIGGKEYLPFETVRGGFAFALDNERSEFFVFDGWMPSGSYSYDFFISDKNLLLVYYDEKAIVINFSTYPLKEKKGVDMGISPTFKKGTFK